MLSRVRMEADEEPAAASALHFFFYLFPFLGPKEAASFLLFHLRVNGRRVSRIAAATRCVIYRSG